MKSKFYGAVLLALLAGACSSPEEEIENELGDSSQEEVIGSGGSDSENSDDGNNSGDAEGENSGDAEGENSGDIGDENPDNGNGNGDDIDGGSDYAGDEIDIFSNLSYDEMVYVEGGTFLMGAQSSSSSLPNYDNSGAYYNEQPVHAVTLSSYYIGKYEVTQGLWEYVMSYSGKAADGSQLSSVGPYLRSSKPSSSYGVGDVFPVYYVSYNDIVNYFIPRLNKITGKKFRLPTEAEWEYAARGGQKDEYTRTHTSPAQNSGSGTYYQYAGSNDPDVVAWYGSYLGGTHPVGSKSPNALGLYDMSGNVSEWCSDWYSSNYSSSAQPNLQGLFEYVLRGGSWSGSAYGCRVSDRFYFTPGSFHNYIGLRLALRL